MQGSSVSQMNRRDGTSDGFRVSELEIPRARKVWAATFDAAATKNRKMGTDSVLARGRRPS